MLINKDKIKQYKQDIKNLNEKNKILKKKIKEKEYHKEEQFKYHLNIGKVDGLKHAITRLENIDDMKTLLNNLKSYLSVCRKISRDNEKNMNELGLKFWKENEGTVIIMEEIIKELEGENTED